MKLIKVSKNYQITIPKQYHNLCESGWMALSVDDNKITLKPVRPQKERTEKEKLKELLEEFGLSHALLK